MSLQVIGIFFCGLLKYVHKSIMYKAKPGDKGDIDSPFTLFTFWENSDTEMYFGDIR